TLVIYYISYIIDSFRKFCYLVDVNCEVIVEYPRSLSGAKYIFVRKSVFFGYKLKLLISTAGGRFPRAWLEPPCASHSGVSKLMGLHYRSSHRRPFAIPANVFGGASGYAQPQAPIFVKRNYIILKKGMLNMS